MGKVLAQLDLKRENYILKLGFIFGVFLLSMGDILWVSLQSDITLFSILAFYIVGIRFFSYSSNTTFLIALGMLSITYFSYLISGPSVSTERAAVWVFFYFTIGIVQRWRE